MTLRYHKKNMPCFFLRIIDHHRKSIKIDRYPIQTVNIKDGSFFQYRFHIAQSDGVILYY